MIREHSTISIPLRVSPLHIVEEPFRRMVMPGGRIGIVNLSMGLLCIHQGLPAQTRPKAPHISLVRKS